MSYFKDKDIEEAMLKSCLLFNSKEIKNYCCPINVKKSRKDRLNR